MARIINADLEYASWYGEMDWVTMAARSITRWGADDDYKFPPAYRETDIRLDYGGSAAEELMWQFRMRRFRSEMGFRAVVLSAMWYWKRSTLLGTGTFDMRCHAFLKAAGYPDLDDCDSQYRDISALDPWFNGGYCPQYGHDITANYVARAAFDMGIEPRAYYEPLDLTAYFAQQLLDNEDLWLELFQVTSSAAVGLSLSASKRPKLVVSYFYPIEMFPSKAVVSEIDLSRLLNTDNEPINLGAYQRNEVGTAQRFFLKNFSGQAITTAEVLDDFPEWTTPVADSGNTGSGVIGYVVPFDACVSQRWEVKILAGGATYEVKATDYLDNLESLHSAYDADAAWQGAIASDETFGGILQIPAAAWSGTPAAGDLFVIYTRGNTTDPSWPADSNQQVEMCNDSGGAPDGNWTPILGRRTLLATGVTIDSTSKTLTVRHIDTTKWPTGTRVWIGDSTNIDRGEITGQTATSLTITFDTASGNSYAAGVIVATTLAVRNIPAAEWGRLTAESGVSQPAGNRDKLYIANVGNYFGSPSRVFVQSMVDNDTWEEATVDSVQSGYLLLTTDLVNDYEEGALVASIGSGEASFWLRVVAGAATDEERKEFRLSTIA